MRKYIILSILFVMLGAAAFAQRVAYVDSEYILKHIPEYSSAQKQLDALAEQWQKEIDVKFAEVNKMQKEYQADRVLLTDAMKKQRETEIEKREKEAIDSQQQRFGFQGELFNQKIRLIKPIQDRVAKAVEDYANSESIDIIIDKSTVTLLFARSTFDGTNDIITRMGYKPGSFAK
ncbi:MAG: OmpH family outer membrane protein [Bacteroidetes bacterium]|nr:OmpH family outer membrane protein [Bacteroidota bacterium]MBU1486274.1 OmpH family outer membrane protein [Bacteroidota bacterium]MBU2266880.1 OmpH family outer membrane protein [Bacteroidota bacterium]MBU2376090.1 OmpH family outer membrane protein [Bacteroidota bacterium]